MSEVWLPSEYFGESLVTIPSLCLMLASELELLMLEITYNGRGEKTVSDHCLPSSECEMETGKGSTVASEL